RCAERGPAWRATSIRRAPSRAISSSRERRSVSPSADSVPTTFSIGVVSFPRTPGVPVAQAAGYAAGVTGFTIHNIRSYVGAGGREPRVTLHATEGRERKLTAHPWRARCSIGLRGSSRVVVPVGSLHRRGQAELATVDQRHVVLTELVSDVGQERRERRRPLRAVAEQTRRMLRRRRILAVLV